MKEKVINYLKKETVLCIAVLLAVISSFMVLPDERYGRSAEAGMLSNDSGKIVDKSE